MQTSSLSNKLRVSKNGLQERKIAEWDNVYEKPEAKIDISYKTEQIIGRTLVVLLLILWAVK